MDLQSPQTKWYLVAAAAVVLAGIAGGIALTNSGNDTSDVGDNGGKPTTTTSQRSTTTTTDDSGSTTTTTATPGNPGAPADVMSQAVWPRPSSTTRFTDPVKAASSFARFYADFPNPVVGKFRQGDNRSGEVPIKPIATGPETTVLVRQLSDDNWYVIGAVTDNITVTKPTTGDQLSCPQQLTGTALAFEGTVHVRIDAYQPDGKRVFVGNGIVNGGGGPAAPFNGQISCRIPTGVEPYGIITFGTADESGEPGRSGAWETVSFPVKLR